MENRNDQKESLGELLRDRFPPSSAGPPVQHIAIMGVSCRLPAGIETGSFRAALQSNIDTITPIPADRHMDWVQGPEMPQMAGFLQPHPRFFDHQFFGVNAAAAKAMDPQQGLGLEASYEAANGAGFFATWHRLQKVAVMVGSMNLDSNLEQLVCTELSTLTQFSSCFGVFLFTARAAFYYCLRTQVG